MMHIIDSLQKSENPTWYIEIMIRFNAFERKTICYVTQAYMMHRSVNQMY